MSVQVSSAIGPLDPGQESFYVVGGAAGHSALTSDLISAANGIQRASQLVDEAQTAARRAANWLDMAASPGTTADTMAPWAARRAITSCHDVANQARRSEHHLDDVAIRLRNVALSLEAAEWAAYRHLSAFDRSVEAGKDAVGLAVWGVSWLLTLAGPVSGLPQRVVNRARDKGPGGAVPHTTGIVNRDSLDKMGSLLSDDNHRFLAQKVSTQLAIAESILGRRSGTGVQVRDVQLNVTEPPRQASDILSTAKANNVLGDGSVTVQRLTGEGPDRYVIYLPDTQDFLPSENPADLRSAVEAYAGQPSQAIGTLLDSIQAADIPPGAPVMLVGHSQGGINAMAFVDNAASAEVLNTTHVLTSGAGTSRFHAPTQVNALHLEIIDDVTPGADFAPPVDAPNRTTFSHHASMSQNPELKAMAQTVTGAHHMDSYIASMKLAQSGVSKSVDSYLTSADAFFKADQVETTTFTPQSA